MTKSSRGRQTLQGARNNSPIPDQSANQLIDQKVDFL